MKKSVFLVLCLCLLSYPVAAEEDSFWNDESKNAPSNNPAAHNGDNSTGVQTQGDISEGELDENIYSQYGSVFSPAFLNRLEENPNEADYAYGSSSGNSDHYENGE